MINGHETINVFNGVDVGKAKHHAVALNKAGKKLACLGPTTGRGQDQPSSNPWSNTGRCSS